MMQLQYAAPFTIDGVPVRYGGQWRSNRNSWRASLVRPVQRLNDSMKEVLPRHRRFRDRDGAFWSVEEVQTAGTPGARGPRCLLFESDHAVRRVWEYPSDWYAMDLRQLEELSWRR
jgi:hypothetical protein